jgi:hypothetical protein
VTIVLRATDCPDCRSTGSVIGGLCDVCFAEHDERSDRPASGDRSPADQARPLRFSDVLAELRAIAALDRDRRARGSAPHAMAEACHRAESMLLQLRREFMQELGISGAPAQRKTSHTG